MERVWPRRPARLDRIEREALMPSLFDGYIEWPPETPITDPDQIPLDRIWSRLFFLTERELIAATMKVARACAEPFDANACRQARQDLANLKSEIAILFDYYAERYIREHP